MHAQTIATNTALVLWLWMMSHGLEVLLGALGLMLYVADKTGVLGRDAIEGATPRRVYWMARLLVGLMLLAVAGKQVASDWLQSLGLDPRSVGVVDFAIGLLGFAIAFLSVSPLVRSFSVQHKLGAAWGKDASSSFLRATIEEQVACLLLGVAAADGAPGERERKLVRQFLLARFPSDQTRAQIDHLLATTKPPNDLELLAKALALRLADNECATLYSWCCLVAFADGHLHPHEARVLQAIARGFAIPPRHAQFLFEYAQNSARAARDQDAWRDAQDSTGSQRQGSQHGRRAAPTQRDYGTPRERALQTLGLPADATKEQIRQRHRELVRKFHPDAHQRLGPVAQQEAAERFKAIQRAYEELAK